MVPLFFVQLWGLDLGYTMGGSVGDYPKLKMAYLSQQPPLPALDGLGRPSG